MTAMETAIRSAINQRIKEIADEETAKAIDRVRARSLEQVAASVLGIQKWTDFATYSDRLVITVRFPDKTP